jgi:hypothetical protein
MGRHSSQRRGTLRPGNASAPGHWRGRRGSSSGRTGRRAGRCSATSRAGGLIDSGMFWCRPGDPAAREAEPVAAMPPMPGRRPRIGEREVRPAGIEKPITRDIGRGPRVIIRGRSAPSTVVELLAGTGDSVLRQSSPPGSEATHRAVVDDRRAVVRICARAQARAERRQSVIATHWRSLDRKGSAAVIEAWRTGRGWGCRGRDPEVNSSRSANPAASLPFLLVGDRHAPRFRCLRWMGWGNSGPAGGRERWRHSPKARSGRNPPVRRDTGAPGRRMGS